MGKNDQINKNKSKEKEENNKSFVESEINQINQKDKNDNNQGEPDSVKILEELEKKLDKLKEQINNKNDEVKGEREKITKYEILKEIERYQKQIDDLKKVANRVKEKQNQSNGNNKEVNEGEEQKMIEDKKKETKYQNIIDKFNNGVDGLEKFKQYAIDQELAPNQKYVVQGKQGKFYFKQGVKSLSPEDMGIILNTKKADIEKFYNKTHKQTNNNFNEKSLYDISQTIIDKLTNMGKQGYGIGK